MHTVQPALARGAPGRPSGPTLGTGVPAKGWHWLALMHSSAGLRPALAGNGHWSADQKPARRPFFYPFSFPNHSKMTLNRAWECYHAGTRLLSLLWQQIYPFLPSHSSFSDRRRPLRRGTGHWPVPSARQPGGTGHSSAGEKQELALHWALQFSRKCNTPVPSLALCASWPEGYRVVLHRARGFPIPRPRFKCQPSLGGKRRQ